MTLDCAIGSGAKGRKFKSCRARSAYDGITEATELYVPDQARKLFDIAGLTDSLGVDS
jgi:hypothetical protein